VSQRFRLRAAVAVAALVAPTLGRAQPAPPGSIRGIVFDSLVTHAPLAAATVDLLELGRSVTTDGRGVFRFDSLPGGRYTLSFSHPSLSALGFTPPDRAVELGTGIDVSIVLATPSDRTIYQRLCPGIREKDTGVLLGTLVEAGTNRPVAGGELHGEWTVTLIARETGFDRRPRIVRAGSDSGGRFQLCGVPTDVPVLLQSTARGIQGAPLELKLEGRTFAVRHLAIDLRDSTAPRARLVGKVTADGAPVADAQVLAIGSDQIARTAADGSFELRGLTAGSHTVEARAIGYSRKRIGLDIEPEGENRIAFTLTKVAVALPELTVTAAASAAAKSGFDQRRTAGLGGYFITAQDIARRGSVRLEDLFKTVPGMRVEPVGLNDYRILSTRGGSNFAAECEPTVYVDDVRMFLDPEAGLSIPIDPTEVLGIEIHPGPATAPVQYRAFGQNCGVILIWTKRGQR